MGFRSGGLAMRELERPVARVFRRMRLQRLLNAFFWTQAVGLLVLAGVFGLEKLGSFHLPAPAWAPYAASGCVGLLLATIVALFTGPSRLDAATAIDRAYQLDERISSALTLPLELRDTPAGRALVADARKRIAEIDVVAEFSFRAPRRSWLILLPLTVLGLVLAAPALAPKMGLVKAAPVVESERKALAEKAQELSRKVNSQREAIDKKTYPEAANLLASVEKKISELAKAPPAAKDKLMLELNKLTDSLKERQKQLASSEQIQKQLQRMKEMSNQGPAEQLARQLARGDFKKAAEQIQQLQDKLASGKLSEQEKKSLEKQLGEMSQKLARMANLEDRKKQLEEARKNGAISQKQFEKEMQKLAEQSKGMQKLGQLAKQLAQAQKELQKGDSRKAAESLGMTQKQLENLAKNLQEIEQLDSTMADIQNTKEGMSGDDMNQLGDDMNNLGQGLGNRRGRGPGLGRGRGAGYRPEAESETSTYQTRVAQQLKKGKAVATGFTEASKTVKGQSTINIQAEIDAGVGSSAEALSNQRIPKSLEKHVRSYYDQISKPQ